MGKSNPIGVRFDIDKSEAIMKENGLLTYQSLVNFLVDGYNRRVATKVEKETNVATTKMSYGEVMYRVNRGEMYSRVELREMGLNHNQIEMVISKYGKV